MTKFVLLTHYPLCTNCGLKPQLYILCLYIVCRNESLLSTISSCFVHGTRPANLLLYDVIFIATAETWQSVTVVCITIIFSMKCPILVEKSYPGCNGCNMEHSTFEFCGKISARNCLKTPKNMHRICCWMSVWLTVTSIDMHSLYLFVNLMYPGPPMCRIPFPSYK